ncbi:hypothetical protein D3C73_1243650 [compost metagenome]
MVDLVHHQMTVTRLDRAREAGQFVAAKDRAGGVGGRGHQRAHAVFVPMTLDEIRRQLISHLGPHRDKLRRTFDQPQEMPVARVARVRQQPVFARIHQQGTGQQQRAGPARSDEDAPWIDVQTVTLLIET